MPNPTLSTNDLARLLSINVSTVKRWADSGQLECIRTLGGHRRFLLEQVHDFLQLKGYDPRSIQPLMEAQEQTSTLESAVLERRWDWLCDHLIAVALSGRLRDVVKLFVTFHLAGEHAAELCDNLIGPTMRKVGDQWARNELTIADEHLVTRVITSALSEMRTHWAAQKRLPYRAICGVIAPDLHELVPHCLSVILMAEGWTALNLGANLPVETLIDAIEKHRPELVALSCTVTYDPVAFRSDCERVVHAAAEAGAHIALGGAALDETVGPCVTNKSVTIVRSMEDFVEFIHSTFRRDQGKCACMNGECASS